jgi:ubiquinone/menaquinone biosynthesis C-methylase UbiE
MTNSPGDIWLADDAYEAYMGRWSRPLARLFVEWLNPKSLANWLEVGCGTGALTSAICDICEPASIVACDPSGPFIEYARTSFPDARASFLMAGAEALPNRDGGFDAVVSGLVLNFLPDAGKAVSSMRERLRPGGTVAAYVWDYADGMEFLIVGQFEFKRQYCPPRLGGQHDQRSCEGWFPNRTVSAMEPPRLAFGSASPPNLGGEFSAANFKLTHYPVVCERSV